jgi:cephalosporin-C deacetylase-like acetyl esterase
MQETMAYFDLLNLTENIRRPALVDIGRKDVTYPY